LVVDSSARCFVDAATETKGERRNDLAGKCGRALLLLGFALAARNSRRDAVRAGYGLAERPLLSRVRLRRLSPAVGSVVLGRL
jgi:hypothetical protein